ncbi:MAG: M23 family metallopeptidase, partial [Bacteroidota bacterium]
MGSRFQVSGFGLLQFAYAVLISVFISTCLKAQSAFPKNYFTSPMFLPLNLAGNFGEIRSNHFHSGIDIKTNELEGQVVMAAADGYVSRIKISSVGFGNALYINHPNGFTTVYGHLQRFNDSIQSYIEAEQYKKESFEIDLSLDSNLFPVRQGQLIALSGNTGSSEGPHLHFEIRNKISEHPLNPLLFGLHSEDTIAPVIENIKIYQLHETKYGFLTDTTFNVRAFDSSIKSDTVFVSEKTAFSVEASDKMNDTSSNLVPNKIELFLDSKIIYTYHFDEFSFDESRYVNANIDYAEKVNEKKKYILLFRLPGNDFSMF